MNRFNAAVLCLLLASGCGGGTTSGAKADLPEIKDGTKAVFISNFKFKIKIGRQIGSCQQSDSLFL